MAGGHNQQATLVQSTVPSHGQSGKRLSSGNSHVQSRQSTGHGSHLDVTSRNRVTHGGNSHVVSGGHSHVVSGGHPHVVSGGHSHVVSGGHPHVVSGGHSHVRRSHTGQPQHYGREGERRSVRRSQRRGEESFVNSTVTHHGNAVEVGQNRMTDKQTVQMIPRESHVISNTQGDSRVISQDVVSSNIINQYDHALPQIRHDAHINYSDVSKDVYFAKEHAHINEIIKEKFIDIIVEKPVPRERIVEVVYDVYIEKPVEKIIEKEVIVEKVVEVRYDKIIEVPIEKIVEVPIEKIIEKPVYIEEIFEIPVEVIIEDEVEYITENIVYDDKIVEIDQRDIHNYRGEHILQTIMNQEHVDNVYEVPRYVDNIIHQEVQRPYDNIIEVDKVIEQKIEREYTVDVHVDKERVVVENIEVEKPYTTVVEVENHINQPCYYDNIIERRIDVPVRREEVIERPYDVIIENKRQVPYDVVNEVYQTKYIDVENIIREPVYRENVVRRPYYTEDIVEHMVENKVYNHYEVVVEKEQHVDKIINETIERPYENVIECKRDVTIEHPYEVIREHKYEVPEYVEKERIVENIIRKPVDNIIEKIVKVENIVEQEVVYEVEKRVPREIIVEEHIEVEKEFVTKVKVDVEVRREIYVDNIIETEVIVENRIEQPCYKERVVECDRDGELEMNVRMCEGDLEALNHRKESLEHLCQDLHEQIKHMSMDTDYFCEIGKLRRQIAQIQIEISALKRTTVKATHKEKQINITYIPCPEATALRKIINEMESKNKAMKQRIEFQDTRIAHGFSNYQLQDQVVDGKKVRQLRKSNKNMQNESVVIRNEGGSHLVSKIATESRLIQD